MKAGNRAVSAKAALRASVLARRDALDEAWRAGASARISEQAWSIVSARQPRTLAAYLPRRSECDPRGVIARSRDAGTQIVLPAVLAPTEMVFRRFREGAPLAAGGFGTLAPTPDEPVLDPDLILVPLVGFDRRGTRLGHGRGFYDRALAVLWARGVKPALVGIGFSVQEVPAVPAEAHDIPLDWIVTERETIVPSQGK